MALVCSSLSLKLPFPAKVWRVLFFMTYKGHMDSASFLVDSGVQKSLFSYVMLKKFEISNHLVGLIGAQFPISWGYHASLPPFPSRVKDFETILAFRVIGTKLFCLNGSRVANKYGNRWSFKEGSRLLFLMQDVRRPMHPKRSATTSSWMTSSQLASNAFTLGTAAVLPFYTLMVLAPKADLTKRSMESSIPYVVLGILYAYLLYLSWTPDTIRLMFASKYWLPELPGIAKMFSNEMTLASAWIHLLAVDLFAARQVYHDGLKNEIETRHSVSLCLLFCPVGILSHVFTKVFTRKTV